MNKNVELFKKSYKNGFEVYLNPKEIRHILMGGKQDGKDK